MIINDKVYGKTKITEPVLLELLKSPAILRLKNISQFGMPDKYYHIKNFSRYEHSVGVMILLKKLGASLEEQVAGLLHDVSHLAFSHVSDFVFGKGRQGIEDYHDLISEAFIKQTDIPKIIGAHGLDLKRIVEDGNFTLLENILPNLCADRLDYALREFEVWLNPLIIGGIVRSLSTYQGQIVITNKKAALDLAANFLRLQTENWGSQEAMFRVNLFSEALKGALDKNILTEADFFKDEKHILNKLVTSKNQEIQQILKTLRNKKLKVKENKTGEKIIKKFRFVDPKILIFGKIIRLSEVSSEFVKILEQHRKINQAGLYV